MAKCFYDYSAAERESMIADAYNEGYFNARHNRLEPHSWRGAEDNNGRRIWTSYLYERYKAGYADGQAHNAREGVKHWRENKRHWQI